MINIVNSGNWDKNLSRIPVMDNSQKTIPTNRIIHSKRGELTSSYIITTILIIAGFVIVLYFILNVLNLGGETTDDICSFSVLTRATSPETTSAYIPLKCMTKKICLSDRGDCENFKGEENVHKTVRLPSDEIGAKKEIEKTLANQMYECWNMMGEGKLDLFNGGFLKTYGQEKQDVTCVICTRIIINHTKMDSIMKYDGNNNENKVNVEKYMEENQIEGKSETYLQYFAKDRSVNGYKKIPEELSNNILNADNANVEIENEKIEINKRVNFKEKDLSEYAVVFSQIKPKKLSEALNKLASLGITATVAGAQTPFVGSIVKSGPGIALIAVTGAGLSINAMLNVHQGKVAAASFCSNFQNEKESKVEGCSSVQILPYEVGSINSICSYIEGDP